MKKTLSFLCFELLFMSTLFAQIGSPIGTKTISTQIQLNPLQNYYSKRIQNAIKLSNTFKSVTTNFGNYSATQEGLSSVVTVNKTPLFPQPLKTETTISGGACAPFKVNFKKSDIEFAVDAGTNAQLRTKIYPGSLLNATGIISGNFNATVPNLPVNSMNIISNMLPAQNTDSSFRTVTTPSAANINTVIDQMYNRNALGSTNAPAMQFIEGYILESDNQWKAESKHTWELNVNNSLMIPLEAINIKLGGGPSGSTSTSGSVTLQKKKSYAVLSFRQVFYTAYVEMIMPQGTAGGSGKYFNTSDANIPADLLYIKTVDYGRIIYLIISAEVTRQELAFAISQKFGINIDLGLNVAGVDVVSADQGGSVSSEFRLNRVFQQSNISYKTIVYGGNPLPISDLIISSTDVLNNQNGLGFLINKITSKVNVNLSSSNVPAPIGFTCCFARDGATAWVNSNINFYSETCPSNFRYDVQLELDRIEVSNCRDLDGSEDLYGEIKFTYLKAGSKEVNTDKVFWTKEEDNANENSFRNGTRQVDKTIDLINGLTYEELRSVTLFVGAKLYDDESVLPSRKFQCNTCQEFSGDFGKRKIYFSELSNTQKSLNSLIPDNGQFQPLKFGDDTYFHLVFYESGNSNDGIVKIYWRFKVKAYTVYNN